jgi:hypothetical protein
MLEETSETLACSTTVSASIFLCNCVIEAGGLYIDSQSSTSFKSEGEVPNAQSKATFVLGGLGYANH